MFCWDVQKENIHVTPPVLPHPKLKRWTRILNSWIGINLCWLMLVCMCSHRGDLFFEGTYFIQDGSVVITKKDRRWIGLSPEKKLFIFSRATNRRCWEYSYADTISSAYHTSRLSRRNLSGDQAGIVFDKRFVSFDTACGISKVLDVIRLLITDPLGLRWTTYRWNLGMWPKECGCKHRCILAHQWMIFFLQPSHARYC